MTAAEERELRESIARLADAVADLAETIREHVEQHDHDTGGEDR